jgi:predicted Rossmann-fold nucleotide-binding protein
MHEKPVVLLDPDTHWTGLLSWVRELRSRGFASDVAFDLLTVTRTVDDALDACGPMGSGVS